MPIPPELWKKYVKNYLERISNRRYQELVWFNRPREEWRFEESSPGELINGLFHDSLFDEFIQAPQFGLTGDQKLCAQSFARSIREFAQGRHGPIDPIKTIDDPHWDEIRNAAKELLARLAL
jgi:hypothetical protein